MSVPSFYASEVITWSFWCAIPTIVPHKLGSQEQVWYLFGRDFSSDTLISAITEVRSKFDSCQVALPVMYDV